MEAQLNIGEVAAFKLDSALLIYTETGNRNRTAVTVHDVLHEPGKPPVLEAGQPVTYSAVESLAAALGRNLAANFLPANVLSVGFGQVAWWCPAARRRLWFKPDGRFDGGAIKDDSETARVMKLNGKFAQHPPLMFVARDRSLHVYALAENLRPDADTRLFKAPYWNLWEGGKLCEGNRKLAELPTPASIPAYEDGFFNSAFSHTNIKRVCNFPGGHAPLWKALVCEGKKYHTVEPKFWRKHLIKLELTVAKAITTTKE